MRSLHKHTAKLTLMLFLAAAAIHHYPVLTAAAGEAGEILKDTQGHWAEQEIGEAVRKGYVSGYGDGTFRPEQTVNRIHYVVMLVKLMKYPVVPSPEDQTWFDPYGQTARDLNLLPETAAALKWDEPLTRREMLYIAYKAVQGEEAAPADDRIIEWAREESLLNGDGSGELHLEQTATRAQTVVFLERLDKAVHR